MFEVGYCDQAGAQPPIAVGSLSWSEEVAITARLLITERVRSEFEHRFERFDARGGEVPAALVTLSANARAMTLDETIETALPANFRKSAFSCSLTADLSFDRNTRFFRRR